MSAEQFQTDLVSDITDNYSLNMINVKQYSVLR
jgi:hypothetical protein